MTPNIKIAVFDLDGCMFDDRHRLHLLPDYDAYNVAHMHDKPQHVGFFSGMCSQVDHVLFITARDAKWRGTTHWQCTGWMLKHGHGRSHTLLMRESDDKRKSPVLKPALLRRWLKARPSWQEIDVRWICDDRGDVLSAYKAMSGDELVNTRHFVVSHNGFADFQPKRKPEQTSAADVLQEMANTFRERNAVYGDNYKQVPQLMKVLFPGGVPSELVVTDHFHLFELILVKLSRFAISGLTHQDSIHDAAVYGAMIEAILREQQA